MKKFIFSVLTFSLLALPALVTAHEHQGYKIGNKHYEFTIGSLNEPVFVDDKSGVYFSVEEVAQGASHGNGGVPVSGLEKTLKVEISAGDNKKVLDFSPAYDEPGAYTAAFYPTVATTYNYRVFGNINDVEVNLSFTCNPAGHPATSEDMTEVVISSSVTRMMKSGAFGCPRPRADAGFPETVASTVELSNDVDAANAKAGSSGMMGVVGIILGLIGAVLGAVALVKSRKPQQL